MEVMYRSFPRLHILSGTAEVHISWLREVFQRFHNAKLKIIPA